MVKHKLLLALAILLAIGLRFYQLGSLPVILNRDEAALAYNALLLKETGLDEWSRSWPLTLESFGDYKLPGYAWFLIGFFTLFGSSDWVVRLPAAIAGVWLAVVCYLIARSLKWSRSEALVILFSVAVTPVFIFYSRMAWEAMLSLSLAVTAFYLIWMAKVDHLRRLSYDLLGLFLLGIAIFTYNTPFLMLPFLIPAVAMLRKWRQPTSWIVPVVGLVAIFCISAIVFIPLTSQKSGITLFSDPTIFANWVTFRQQLPASQQSTIGHRYVYQGVLILQRILASWGPVFLSLRGGSHPWHQVPGQAHVFWTTLFLSWLGLAGAFWAVGKSLLTRMVTRISKVDLGLLYLTGVTLLPSVITVDAPHATRSLSFFLVLLFFSVRGWQLLRDWLEKAHRSKYLVFFKVALGCLLILETVKYSKAYFWNYPTTQNALKPGLEQALNQIEEEYPDQKVAIVDPDGYTYILVAWYQKISPAIYFSTIIRQQPDRIGFRYGQQLAQYHFIAQASDHLIDETIILEWQQNQWQIKN